MFRKDLDDRTILEVVEIKTEVHSTFGIKVSRLNSKEVSYYDGFESKEEAKKFIRRENWKKIGKLIGCECDLDYPPCCCGGVVFSNGMVVFGKGR